ncbi:MAG: alpha/beta hydrolase [Chitinophagaceae bacterium]|nr:alpha/beta hydrolase [Chitinophagaceae bacterium]
MPLLLLFRLLADLLSVAFFFAGYYFWREWDRYHDTAYDNYAHKCLYILVAIGLYIFFGKFLVRFLISKKRNGEEEPYMFKAGTTEKIKSRDGNIINVEYYGKQDGQTIIFIHGWNSNIKSWFYQKRYFEHNYRLIMIDLPGLGKSTRPGNNDFSLSKMAKDLNTVIEYTGAKNPVLWGHSIGGMIILTLLAKHHHQLTTNIKGIILEHTTYINPVRTILFSKFLTAIQKPVLTPLCYILIGLSPIIWLSRWMSYLNGNSHIMTRYLTFAGTQTGKQLDHITLLSTLAPPAVTARGVLGMFNYDVSRELKNIQVPALIIAADKDRLTRPNASRYMEKSLPQAELVTVKPGGHQALVERHTEVNEAATLFITRLN